jgi:hypothetical protein
MLDDDTKINLQAYPSKAQPCIYDVNTEIIS